MVAVAPTLTKISKRDRYNAILSQMEGEYNSWKNTLQDIGDYIAPYKHEFNHCDTGRGERRDQQIINNAPLQAVGVGVAGLVNGLCDPTEEWVGFEADDPEVAKSDAAQKYCEEITARFLTEINKSNWQNVAPELFGSILSFGTCSSEVRQAFKGDSCLWFGALPMGSYFAANNDERKVDQLARRFQWTARQMAAKFPQENLSEPVRQALATNRAEQKFQIVHVITPNPEHREGAMLSRHKRFMSCYYEPSLNTDPEQMLEEAGFDYFPAPVARWGTLGENTWGHGPGHDALGDARSLQVWEFDIALARELELKPPMDLPAGRNPAAVSVLPGAMNANTDPTGAQGLKPVYQIKFNIADATAARNECVSQIKTAFYNNIFLMMANDDGGKMTAREVMERAREKRLALSPILRLTDELLKPICAIGLEIMGKRGKLPPFPPEMANQRIKIVFKGVLAQAAKMEKAAAIERHLEVLAAATALFPDAPDNYDGDKILRGHARDSGVRADYMRSPEDVQRVREARAQQAQQQAELAQAEQAAGTAKTLSEADTSGKNALTDVVAGMTA